MRKPRPRSRSWSATEPGPPPRGGGARPPSCSGMPSRKPQGEGGPSPHPSLQPGRSLWSALAPRPPRFPPRGQGWLSHPQGPPRPRCWGSTRRMCCSGRRCLGLGLWSPRGTAWRLFYRDTGKDPRSVGARTGRGVTGGGCEVCGQQGAQQGSGEGTWGRSLEAGGQAGSGRSCTRRRAQRGGSRSRRHRLLGRRWGTRRRPGGVGQPGDTGVLSPEPGRQALHQGSHPQASSLTWGRPARCLRPTQSSSDANCRGCITRAWQSRPGHSPSGQGTTL